MVVAGFRVWCIPAALQGTWSWKARKCTSLCTLHPYEVQGPKPNVCCLSVRPTP